MSGTRPVAQDTGAGGEHWALEVRWVPLAYRMGSSTGVTPGQTRLSGSTWRRVRTVRWFCPATTWTCSPCLCLRISSTGVTGEGFCPGLLLHHPFPPSWPPSRPCSQPSPSLPPRTHANGSIKRGSKDNATESVPLRTGIGVQLKDIKVFNRDRQKGEAGALGQAGEAHGGPPGLGVIPWSERGWERCGTHGALGSSPGEPRVGKRG